MSNIAATKAAPAVDTSRLIELSSQLSSHPQYNQWSNMHVGPYTMPTQLRSNEEAAGIQECIELDVAIHRELENMGIPSGAQALADKYPMIPA